MTERQALAVKDGITKILRAFRESDYKVATKLRRDNEYEVHIFTTEKEMSLYKAVFLWRGLEEVLSGTVSIESNYNAGTTECDFRESFKIW